MEHQTTDLIIKGMDGALFAKSVAYDFRRMMQGATKLQCSEFGQAIITYRVWAAVPHSKIERFDAT